MPVCKIPSLCTYYEVVRIQEKEEKTLDDNYRTKTLVKLVDCKYTGTWHKLNQLNDNILRSLIIITIIIIIMRTKETCVLVLSLSLSMLRSI